MKTPAPNVADTSSEAHSACRVEIEAAMHRLIKAAVKQGWSKAEVALTLADAAEDFVMELAGRTPTQH
ncbi:hypothetical protein EPK99_14565 [Neorhizobium lilium]|uniref:Uncharacterized protein n=1 Tax=Neorhizobium lilium TaxID=2503024 RepID=A0A444LFK6_9HYPH|nr:hypothetical protein [Neorhizobium lilium]RWX76891.1 hypothetical protein EPK99_14565 [Neorhizobium lilium]